ncbi:MAG: ATP-binding cassette domain-containing protein [Lachnospiraceae bacterium]|nr:ATP-binding cassette domain-containing protein [Lachnospiraceae bacterium]
MSLYVDIEKRCGDFRLRVKFETKQEMFAILGASGCGKSLTLKCIAGIEKPDTGVIKLNDTVFFDSSKRINIPTRKRGIGYLFQDYALFPNMTVFQNILCGAGNKKKAREYMKKFFLEEQETLYPAQLSGGQKQRVALARMLAQAPRLVMFDEPFSALDNYLKTQLEREVMNAMETFENGGIFVSHDRNEVYRLTDRIAVMENGSIVDIQDKHGLFDAPKTLAATLLTGCKNITRLEMRGDGCYALDWGMMLSIPKRRAKAGKTFRYASVRAHFLELADAGEQDAENVIACDIIRVIEDTFSNIVLFTNRNMAGKTGYAVMTFELPKEAWQKIKDKPLYLKIPTDKLILMER